MDSVITVGGVLTFVGIVGGIGLLIALLLGAIWLMNPFRTGH